MENCKVIAVTNQKGGVGKTTTTVNLGVGLANDGYKVLLIDADPQGSLTVSLGIKAPDELDVSLASVLDGIINDEPIDSYAGIISHDEGVDLLPSNIELSAMETKLFNTMSREYVLRNYIDTVRQDYDYILIDCMPSLGMMTINALVAADSVIIPSQPNFLSTKGLNLLLHSISKVKRSINPNLRIDGILLTMVDSRTSNARNIIDSLRSGVGQNIRVFDTEIPHSVRAAECSLTGQSIFAHDKNGKVAVAYEAIVSDHGLHSGVFLNAALGQLLSERQGKFDLAICLFQHLHNGCFGKRVRFDAFLGKPGFELRGRVGVFQPGDIPGNVEVFLFELVVTGDGVSDKRKVKHNASVVDLLIQTVVDPLGFRDRELGQFVLDAHFRFDVSEVICLKTFPFLRGVFGIMADNRTVLCGGGSAEISDEVFTFFQLLFLQPQDRTDTLQR